MGRNLTKPPRGTPAVEPYTPDAADRAQVTRRRHQLLTSALISELNAVDPLTNVTKARTIIINLVEMAAGPKANLEAILAIFDRVEGKARQQVDVQHDGEVTIRSAALSAVDALIAEAIRTTKNRDEPKPVPE